MYLSTVGRSPMLEVSATPGADAAPGVALVPHGPVGAARRTIYLSSQTEFSSSVRLPAPTKPFTYAFAPATGFEFTSGTVG